MTLPSWSRKVMLLNIAFLYPLVFLGGYILWQKAQPIFWLYLLIFICILTVDRYFICCPCPYYGKDCPSFGFSYLARIFPKDETRGFNARACMIEFAIFGVLLLLPAIVWVSSFFGRAAAFSTMEHVLVGIFISMVILMEVVHERTGCSKCEIEKCPMSKVARGKKR